MRLHAFTLTLECIGIMAYTLHVVCFSALWLSIPSFYTHWPMLCSFQQPPELYVGFAHFIRNETSST